MAWIGEGNKGRWINRKERAELIEIYRTYIEMLDEQYPSLDDMNEYDMAEYLEKTEELERLERVHRCEHDTLEFAIEYFSDVRNPDNDGNWDGFDVKNREESPEFHREITADRKSTRLNSSHVAIS